LTAHQTSYSTENRQEALADLLEKLERHGDEHSLLVEFGRQSSVTLFHSDPGDRHYLNAAIRTLGTKIDYVRGLICSEEISQKVEIARKKGRAELCSAILDAVLLALSGPAVVTIAAIIILRGHDQFCLGIASVESTSLEENSSDK